MTDNINNKKGFKKERTSLHLKKAHNSKNKQQPPSLANRSKVYRSNLKAFEECSKIWPDVFSLIRTKPLMIGARQQLLADAKVRDIKITSGKLYNAIYWLTSTYQYQLALCKFKTRFDLHGKEAGEVTPEQRADAQAALRNLSPSATKVMDIKRRKWEKERRAMASRENKSKR